jgi:Fe2+ transport system protein FeoA
MTFVQRIRRTLLGGGEWKDSCEAGAPVPEPGGCRNVDCDSVRLTAVGRGGRGTVSCLEEPWTPEAAKLAALGLLPGVRVRVLQRRPVYVVRIGRTEIALDETLASRIRLHPEAV